METKEFKPEDVFSWDDILTDAEAMHIVRELADSPNPSIKLATLKWIVEGKGHKTGLVDMNVESITFHGLDGEDKQDVKLPEVDNTEVGIQAT